MSLLSYFVESNRNVEDKDLQVLRKTYNFESPKQCQYFFSELYNYQFNINHHCKIIIDNLRVTITTYTHGYGGITEMDKKIKKYCDELESDLNYFIK